MGFYFILFFSLSVYTIEEMDNDHDVNIHIPKKNSESKNSDHSADILRMEESWTPDNEKFIDNIRNDSLHISNEHAIASRANKKMYIGFTIPAIVLPLIVANLSVFLTGAEYVVPICLTFIAILNGLAVLFDFSKKTETHDQYSSLYNELAGEISGVLIRSKAYRNPFDVTVQRLTDRKRTLDMAAPNL